MMFNAAPWQFAQPGGFGNVPGQYGQGIGGGQQGYSQQLNSQQLNGPLAQLGLPPLVAACLAAEGAFASVLAQFGQQQPGAQFQGGQSLGSLPFFSQLMGPPGQQQYGQQGIGGWPVPQGQHGIAGLLAQYGHQGPGGWPGQAQFGGLGGQQGAFGQRGPGSLGSYLPFQVAPQVSYAG
jgi:hypothetical protein